MIVINYPNIDYNCFEALNTEEFEFKNWRDASCPASLKNDLNIIHTIAHELMHDFGGNDKYSGFACAYLTENPEETTDIMCGAVRVGENVWMRELNFSKILVADLTQKEIGWADLDNDDILEVEDPCPFDEYNDC